MERIKNITYTTLSKAWATLKQIDFDYQFSDGTWKRLSRESYNRGNGAGILLYNPKKGTVILTKQFRMPAYDNNPKDGMSIEVCAGAIDHNDTGLETVIREVEEEVGYVITSAKEVMSCYMSPGAVTEKMQLFVAEYSENMKVSEGGGLDIENEDIEIMELPFSEALDMMKSGKIQDAKTLLLLQYAKLNELIK